jgi:hypothetical protein
VSRIGYILQVHTYLDKVTWLLQLLLDQNLIVIYSKLNGNFKNYITFNYKRKIEVLYVWHCLLRLYSGIYFQPKSLNLIEDKCYISHHYFIRLMWHSQSRT